MAVYQGIGTAEAVRIEVTRKTGRGWSRPAGFREAGALQSRKAEEVFELDHKPGAATVRLLVDDGQLRVVALVGRGQLIESDARFDGRAIDAVAAYITEVAR